MVLTAAGSLAFYAYTTYMQKFLVNTAGFTKDTGTAIMAGVAGALHADPAADRLDSPTRSGAEDLLAGAFGALAVLTYPILTTLAHARPAPGRPSAW